jgi:hypothetical protein
MSRYNPANEFTNVQIKRGLMLDEVALTATFTEINQLASAGLSAAELAKLNIAAAASITLTQEVTFTETSGAGTYTGTMALPAGSRIIDIGCDGQVLWNSAGACALVVGDAGAADGFFTSTDLKATDLLAGEINNLEHPGGKAGTYIASEQRNLYSATARDIIAVVTQASGTGTAGRTRVYVTYAIPVPTAATKV